jgi:hypothetical protein
MDMISLSLILAVLFAWWFVTVALASGALNVTRRHSHLHHKARQHYR